MKQINTYIIEKLHLNKDITDKTEYEYHPETKEELFELLKKLLKERGPNANLNDIDVSNIDDMSCLFSSIEMNSSDMLKVFSNYSSNILPVGNYSNQFNGNFLKTKDDYLIHNIDISKWDVSNVKNMYGMFATCRYFNSDLSKWHVDNVVNMSNMFYDNWKFNSDISNWDVSSCEQMYFMFNGCKKFNQNLNSWTLNKKCKGQNYYRMFKRCDSLKVIPDWYKGKQ